VYEQKEDHEKVKFTVATSLSGWCLPAGFFCDGCFWVHEWYFSANYLISFMFSLCGDLVHLSGAFEHLYLIRRTPSSGEG
jgi:hypothetical protein